MTRLRVLFDSLPGLFFHAGGAAALFLCWRLFGLPSPGLDGRLLPLSWLLAAVAFPRIKPHPAAWGCLLTSCLACAFWRTGPSLLLAAKASIIAGLLPAAAAAVKGRGGIFLALLPFAPAIIFLVPFTGDEPTNAALAQSILVDHDLDTSNNIRQMDRWSPVQPEIGDRPDISHHMPLFALLISPGLPFGAIGIRVVCLLISVAAGFMLLKLLRSVGAPDPAFWALASMVLLPGAGVLGLAYPDWTAAGLICAGALLSRGRRGLAWAFAAAIVLAALKLRFAPAGAGLVLAAILERNRSERTRLFAGAAAVLVLLLAADYLLLGGRFFWVRYGNIASLQVVLFRSWASAGSVLLAPFWTLFDSEAGLLWRAPWLLLAPAGMAALRQRVPATYRSLMLASILYAASIFIWMPDFWHGMPTPSGRLFVPLLPLFVSGAAFSGRGNRLLLALSAFPAALAFSMPLVRFNSMDGTDRLLQELGSTFGPSLARVFPSWVRPDPAIAAAWAVAAIVFLWMIYVRRQKAAACFAALCLIGAGYIAPRLAEFSWEAEDLPSDNRIGCSLYPESSDPLERIGWPGSLERLLRLSGEDDAILLPMPSGRDSIELEITLRGFSSGAPAGLEVLCGSVDTIVSLPTGLVPLPDWLASIRGRSAERAMEPGNIRDSTVVLRFPAGGGRILALRNARPVPSGPLDGLYIDRIEIH